jgi:hypothetical protein
MSEVAMTIEFMETNALANLKQPSPAAFPTPTFTDTNPRAQTPSIEWSAFQFKPRLTTVSINPNGIPARPTRVSFTCEVARILESIDPLINEIGAKLDPQGERPLNGNTLSNLWNRTVFSKIWRRYFPSEIYDVVIVRDYKDAPLNFRLFRIAISQRLGSHVTISITHFRESGDFGQKTADEAGKILKMKHQETPTPSTSMPVVAKSSNQFKQNSPTSPIVTAAKANNKWSDPVLKGDEQILQEKSIANWIESQRQLFIHATKDPSSAPSHPVNHCNHFLLPETLDIKSFYDCIAPYDTNLMKIGTVVGALALASIQFV